MGTALRSLADLIQQQAAARGDHVAVVDDHGATRTYRQLADRAARLAAVLQDAGADAGERIGCLLTNRIEYVETIVAAAALGAVIVPVNLRLTPDEIRAQLDDAGVRCGVTEPALEPLAKASGLADRPLLTAGPGWEEAVAAAAPGPPAGNAADPDPLLHIYTSGTTGRAKGCLLTQPALLANAAGVAAGIGLRTDDVFLGWPVLFHIGGWSMALACLTAGATIRLTTRFDPEAVWSLVHAQRITVISLPFYEQLLTHPAARECGASIRLILGLAGGERAGNHELIESTLPTATFFGVYGCTEGGGIALLTRMDDERRGPGALGRPVAGYDVAVLDETGGPAPDGEIGELCLQGPAVMSGYWNLPDVTGRTLRNGWLHTGDRAAVVDGALRFRGRLKDMVKTGGENVDCLEVERVLLEHPAVADVAVFGVPDDRWGEAVKALVVLTDADTATVADLDGHCRRRMAGYKRPRWYEFTDTIPRTSYMKVVRSALSAAHDPARSVHLPPGAQPSD